MLKEKLMEDLKNAMKEKNINRKNVVQSVRAAVLQVEKDQKIEMDDAKVLEVISKEHKKRIDALADFEKAGREDLISQTKEELAVLDEYLPKKLNEEELTEELKKIIQEIGATSIKDMGNIMKSVKEKLGVSADGKMVNEIVRKMF